MAKLIFLRRTEKELEIFGGDVLFDIDGKNMGTLSHVNQEIQLPAGEHTIKMYKSHTYDTFIGFAESKIQLHEDEKLMIQYSAPMMVNQPGNMMIFPYDEQRGNELLQQREQAIRRDFSMDQARKEAQNQKYNTGVKVVIVCAIAVGVIFAIYEAALLSMVW